MTGADLPKGAVRQGGKEELRASLLKTYLLRIRAEKGDRVSRAILTNAGIDPSVVDNETGWVSTAAARRALRAIVEEIGLEGLRRRGEWVTHPEALGTHVRMLRTVEQPIDAYRYLAKNARENTRVGVYEIEEAAPPAEDGKAPKPAAARPTAVKIVYRPRADTGDDSEPLDAASETLFCAAREGELAGQPRIWGFPDAEIVHESCLAKGDDSCTYAVKWTSTETQSTALMGAAGAAISCGLAVGVTGGWVAGVLGGVLAGALGAGAGRLWDKSKRDASSRVFEKNRIAALERGLDLRGEATAAAVPGELTGTVLGGKFRIGRKIGSGGIGVVYAAEHVSLGHEVAVKVLRGAAARDGGEIARLRREAYIQVHIEHPNVARVLDLDQMPDGSMYVVMERLHGRSLADKLSREHVVAPGYGIPLFIGVAKALEAAHQKGVVHRDLKPGNVFLCQDGTPKVLDFGMSKLTTAESLTQAGYTLGTPEYMAPEQCIGANVVPQTDLYAFGVLMYEAFTGDLPISSPNRRELLDLHQRQVPKPMRERRADLDIPEALDRVVMKCLKKRIADRPKSAAELAQMLAAIPLDGLALDYRARKPDAASGAPVEPSGDLPQLAQSEPPTEP